MEFTRTQNEKAVKYGVPAPSGGFIIAAMNPQAVTHILKESAGEHLVRRIPRALPHDRAASVLHGLAGQSWDAADVIYVVDSNGRLQGRVLLTKLLEAAPETRMANLMAPCPAVPESLDQEHVASLALHKQASAVAVTDPAGILLGVVPTPALLTILRLEHVEDLHRLAGIRRESRQALSALEQAPWQRALHRLPWLLVGFVGSILAAVVVSRFEHILSAHVAAAFFVPTIVYLADAVGTQTEAIAVRGLSMSRSAAGPLVAKELATGLLIGLVLAVLAIPSSVLVFGDLELGLALALALLVASTFAAALGLMLPLMIRRLGWDPAFGSGPLATVIQDVATLLIYFFAAMLVVGL